MTPYETAEWSRKRFAVLQRQKRCTDCSARPQWLFPVTESAKVDPLKADESEFIALCEPCNVRRISRATGEFVGVIGANR